MPWTAPRVWVPFDVVSGPRVNDIRDGLRYLRWATNPRNHNARPGSLISKTAGMASQFWHWPSLSADAADDDLGILNFRKREDDTHLFATFAVSYTVTDPPAWVAHSLYINGVDWGGAIIQTDPQVFQYPAICNNTYGGTYRALSGVFKIPVPKGTYNIHLRVKCADDLAFTIDQTYSLDSRCQGVLTIVEHWDGQN